MDKVKQFLNLFIEKVSPFNKFIKYQKRKLFVEYSKTISSIIEEMCKYNIDIEDFLDFYIYLTKEKYKDKLWKIEFFIQHYRKIMILYLKDLKFRYFVIKEHPYLMNFESYKKYIKQRGNSWKLPMNLPF